jgi:hypothetical protein
MFQQKARVYQIEGCFFDWIPDDIVLPNLQRSVPIGLQVASVDVGRDDMAQRRDAFGQPAGNRSTTGSDLEAPPA